MGAFNTVMSIGIVVPSLIYGVMVTVRGIDSIYIFVGEISLLTLLPFWWLVLRSRRSKNVLTNGERHLDGTGNSIVRRAGSCGSQDYSPRNRRFYEIPGTDRTRGKKMEGSGPPFVNPYFDRLNVSMAISDG